MLVAIQLLSLLLLTLLLITHDLVPLGVWNNVARTRTDKSRDWVGTLINTACGLVPLYLAWKDRSVLGLTSGRRAVMIILSAVLIGAIYSWWIPWIFGTGNKQRSELNKISRGTLTLLPDRHGVNPNALHCVIYALTFLSLFETIALLG